MAQDYGRRNSYDDAAAIVAAATSYGLFDVIVAETDGQRKQDYGSACRPARQSRCVVRSTAKMLTLDSIHFASNRIASPLSEPVSPRSSMRELLENARHTTHERPCADLPGTIAVSTGTCDYRRNPSRQCVSNQPTRKELGLWLQNKFAKRLWENCPVLFAETRARAPVRAMQPLCGRHTGSVPWGRCRCMCV